MIDLNLYRFRVGVFNKSGTSRTKGKVQKTGNSNPVFGSSDFRLCGFIYIILIYYILGVACLTMSMSLKLSVAVNVSSTNYIVPTYHSLNLHMTHTKLLSAVLTLFLINRIALQGHCSKFKDYMCDVIYICTFIVLSDTN